MDTGSINVDRVKVAVYNRIKFELPIIIREAIDTAFGNYWNDVIGFGNYVSFEETVNYIDHQFKKRRLCFRMVSWNILSTLYMTILKWLVAFGTKAHFPFHVHHYPMNIYN
jgi:hypothetical protein